ncbi:unnamed protein product [Schistosoma curassoni]|uniref:Uncharacterized protein n=1 Tax=Schistosoma curassoni TaxID=6186 RepID=A0A183JLF1_9TREM|nr:unnamed protein product [Schistosoma curassoni]
MKLLLKRKDCQLHQNKSVVQRYHNVELIYMLH